MEQCAYLPVTYRCSRRVGRLSDLVDERSDADVYLHAFLTIAAVAEAAIPEGREEAVAGDVEDLRDARILGDGQQPRQVLEGAADVEPRPEGPRGGAVVGPQEGHSEVATEERDSAAERGVVADQLHLVLALAAVAAEDLGAEVGDVDGDGVRGDHVDASQRRRTGGGGGVALRAEGAKSFVQEAAESRRLRGTTPPGEAARKRHLGHQTLQSHAASRRRGSAAEGARGQAQGARPTRRMAARLARVHAPACLQGLQTHAALGQQLRQSRAVPAAAVPFLPRCNNIPPYSKLGTQKHEA